MKTPPASHNEPAQQNLQSKGSFARLRILLAGAIIIAAGLLAYCNSFRGPFIYDDVGSIVANPNIRRLWPIWRIAEAWPTETVAGRPVLALSLAVNYQISDLNVWSYHLVNLTIHILAGLVLFGIIRRTLLSEGLKERFARASLILSAICALIWLLHPLQTQSVTYIVQRAESLMGLFYLLSLYCVIRGFSSPNTRPWYAAAVLACALGAGTKEVTATAPLIILLYDRIFLARSFKQLFARRWGLYAGLAGTWLILAALALSAPRGESVGFSNPGLTPWLYALTQCKVIVLYYIVPSFWPSSLVFEYGWLSPESPARFAPYVAVILGLLTATAITLRQRPRLAFLGLWFFIILAPTSSFLPITGEPAAEQRMYLPLAAIIVAVVLCGFTLVQRFSTRRISVRQWSTALGPVFAYALVATAIIALGLLTLKRNTYYRDGLAIWDDTIAKRPDNWRAYDCRALAYSQRGEYDRAILDFDQAITLDPRAVKAYNDRGVAHLNQGHYDLAILDLDEAVKLKASSAKIYNNRGVALMKMGDYPRAFSDFNQAILLSPNFANTYNNRGIAYGDTGDYSQAILDFNTTLRLDPTNTKAYNNRGAAYLGKNDYDNAIRDFNQAIHMNPADASPYNNRGITHLRKGDYDRAIQNFDQAIKLDPKDPSPYNNRGSAHLGKNDYDRAIDDFNQAISLNTKNASPYNNRGSAYLRKNDYDQAISDLDQAIQLNPNYAKAYYSRALAYTAQNEYDRAVRDFDQAIRLNPKDTLAHKDIAQPLILLGRTKEAIAHYRTALKFQPDWPEVLNNLAWILATHQDDKVRDGQNALHLAQRACKLLDYKLHIALDTLAAAYAETDQFDQAIEAAKRALKLAQDAGKKELAIDIQTRLLSYKAKRPWRQSSASKPPAKPPLRE